MVSRDIAKGLVAVLSGMIIFKASSNIPMIEGFFQTKPEILLVLGFVMFFFRDSIVTKLGAK